MRDFDYHLPDGVAEAGGIVGRDDEAKFLAGGMTLIPSMKNGLVAPRALIDLAGIGGLSGIREWRDGLEIGAMTRHVDVAASPLARRRIPSLAALAGGIGDPAVRHRGTIGGSVANSDPAADYPAAVLGLDAVIVTDRREIAADAFFVGIFETALAEAEMITAIRFPKPHRATYGKVRGQASGYAIVGVFIAELADGSIRVAVTGAGPHVFRAQPLEDVLNREFSEAALDGVTISADRLSGDTYASAEYRAHLVVLEAKRAVRAILSETGA